MNRFVTLEEEIATSAPYDDRISSTRQGKWLINGFKPRFHREYDHFYHVLLRICTSK